MSNKLIQRAFTAGVISEGLWSQTTLQKYGYGLAECKNWIISNGGGLISRYGMIAGTLTDLDDDAPFAFIEFTFAFESANTYGLLFTAGKIRFMQGGSWVLEDAKSVSAVGFTATETTVSCTAHGYSVGDLVEFSGSDVPDDIVGQTCVVTTVAGANLFYVQPINMDVKLDFAGSSPWSVSVARVYVVTTHYTDADIPELHFDQYRDQVRITTSNSPVYDLLRQSDGTWTFTETDFNISSTSVTAGSKLASDTGSSAVVYAVTAVDENREESLPYYIRCTGIDNFLLISGKYVRIGWTPVVGARFYNVYRGAVSNASTISTLSQEFGYVMTTYGTVYEETNIAPDYTKSPPRNINPFVDGAIRSISITAAGSGYTASDTFSVTDSDGSGAVIDVIVEKSGAVSGVIIQSGGSGYTNPSISHTGAGTGATFSFELSDEGVNYPRVSSHHQLRGVFGSNIEKPLTLWGTQIGLFNNMGYGRTVAPNEAYSHDLAAPALGYIRHLVSTKYGLLTFTDIGLWIITAQNGAISPTDIDATLESAVGCSGLRPITIDNDIVYGEKGNHVVRMLTYNDYTRAYGGNNISILAGDLIAEPYDLTSWAFTNRPYHQITATRNDGHLVHATVDKEQEVYAWYTSETCGKVVRNIALRESEREVNYFIVKRYLAGRWVYTIEYSADRANSTDETHCGLDCAVPFGFNYGAGKLTLSDDETTFTSTTTDFATASVGDVIRHKGGKAVITNVVSSTVVEVDIVDAFTYSKVPQNTHGSTAVYLPIAAGEWMLSTPVSTFTLPLNFRPAVVSIYGDGITFSDLAVDTDTGVVDLPDGVDPVSIGWIGLPFECRAKTLPLAADGAIIDDARKSLKEVGIRYSRGKKILVGTQEDDYYPIEETYHDIDTTRVKLQSSFDAVMVSSDWDVDTSTYIVLQDAAPATVTGVVFVMEVGDAISDG